MKEAIGILAIIVCVCALMYLSFLEGEKSAQKKIEDRARNTNDIEIIIFGEKQL